MHDLAGGGPVPDAHLREAAADLLQGLLHGDQRGRAHIDILRADPQEGRALLRQAGEGA